MFNLSFPLFNRYIFYEMYISDNIFDMHFDKNIQHITVVEQLKNISFDFNLDEMKRLLNSKVDLFVYLVDNTALGMMCGYRGSCYIRGPGISLLQDNDTVYWFWILTSPKVRGQNVYNNLRNSFFFHYRKAKKITALIYPGNIIMLNQMNVLGFVPSMKFFSVKYNDYVVIYEKNIKTLKSEIRFGYGNRHDLLII